MSDEFGTVNVRSGDRAREIEVLRQRYRSHRDTLGRLAGDAPTDHLAAEYRRLIADVDASVAKLDELEGRPRTMPGDRPLVTPPPPPPAGDPYSETVLERPAPAAGSRILLIVLAATVVLALVGALIWYASRERRKPSTITEQPTATVPVAETTPTSTAPVTPAPTTAAASSGIQITPAMADYGVIRKGTRAVRTFEVRNTSASPVTIQVARSACRCLFYEYKDKIAPSAKETLTVTVDGAKAKSGNLNETIQVTGKKDPSVNASFGVQAVIR